MSSAPSVVRFLESFGVAYDTVPRPLGPRRATGRRRSVPAERVLKPLLLMEEDRHALAVIPKNRRLDLVALNRQFHRRFRLGTEEDAQRLYPGLPLSLLLPAGIGAQVEIYVDQFLVSLREIVIDTPDYSRLIKIEGDGFSELFNGAWCARISRPVD